MCIKYWLSSIIKAIIQSHRVRPSRAKRRWLKKKYTPRLAAAGLAVAASTLLVSGAAVGQCDGPVFSSPIFTVGDNPASVTTGDFNGDGLTDLAAANRYSHDVSILLGNGNGTFAPQQSYAVGNSPGSVTTGDFNGDGLTDLATANRDSSDVSILLGNGDGTFSDSQLFAVGTRPYSITTGDFNGDGLTDVATANFISDDVSILLNQCSGGSSTVVPEQLTVFRGFQIGGKLVDVFESDDLRMRFNPGFTLSSSEAPVWLIFDGALPSDGPTSLQIVMESQAGTPGLTHTLEAFNWNSSDYDVFDVSAASFNSDVVVIVDLSSEVSDYAQSETGDVRTRVGWRKTGLTINFPWEVRLDQLVWIVQ